MIDGTFAARSGQQQQRLVSTPQAQAPHISAAQTQQTVQFPNTPAEFDRLVSSSNLAIAFFTSETCGPCKMVEPHYHSLSKTHTNITFIHVDTHKAFAVAQAHQITATPTFKTYLNGQLYAEWKGANPSSLDSNLARLIEVARPPLPPSLRGNYSQSPILFSRAPPMEKIIPKLPAGVLPKPLLESISTFLSAKGNTDIFVPPLSAWAKVQRELDYSVENAWMIVDLLRAGMADRRISGWFAIDGLDILAGIVKTVNSRDEGEWQLRVVAAQLVSPFISSTNDSFPICFRHRY
jgi:desumoylating isopeptidase 1